MSRAAQLALAASLLLIAACGDAASDHAQRSASTAGIGLPQLAQGPSAAAESFLHAIAADDPAGYEALMTSAAQRELHADGGARMSFDGQQIGGWVLGTEVVEGELATVPTTVEKDGAEQPLSLKLRRENGAWRVRGMAVPMGDDEWFVDFEGGDDAVSKMGEELAQGIADGMSQAFEQAAAEWEAGGSAEQIAAVRESYEALESVDETTHDEAWRVDVDAAGAPAAEVLARLLSGSGLSAATDARFDRASQVKLSQVSRLEAVEALCVEAGAVPVYPGEQNRWSGEPSELTFADGPRSEPVAFAGPFMVETSGLIENAPNSTGEVTITVRALGLHPAVLAANRDMAEVLTLEHVVGPTGLDLLADGDVHWMGSPTVEGGLFSYSLSSDLKNLLQDVESFSMAGEVVLRLPVEVHETSFADGPDDEPAHAGPWNVAWEQSGEFNSFTVTHEDGERTDAAVRFAPDFASGEPMGIQSESSSAGYASVSANLATPEVPAALRVKAFAVRELRQAWHIDGLPLHRFSEQPADLEPLAFSGSAPLDVQFVEFVDRSNADMPSIALHVANNANLAAAEAQVTFEYLDGAGQLLADFPHALSGDFTVDGQQPLALVDQSARLETTAFFMPEQTHELRVRVESVKFVNGTTWSRE